MECNSRGGCFHNRELGLGGFSCPPPLPGEPRRYAGSSFGYSGRTMSAGTELSLRALILGVLITLVFTAANVYFGLKAGLTFATSIPAAVISMAVLRGFKGTTIQENNIVQTVASAAGTLSAIIFVLPGLVMIGWWTGFPYLYSFAICALGGVLGVMYSIPLRRALVTNSDLPYPEGVACAEVLKVGGHGAEEQSAHAAEITRNGLVGIVVGTVVSSVFAVVIATQLFASDVVQYFRVGTKGAVTGYDFSLSFALLAVGHLVGLWVGVAMLVGALIAWGGAVPILASLHPVAGAAVAVGQAVWSHQVRFVGAGTIGIASIWTLIKLIKPLSQGLRAAIAASRLRKTSSGMALPRTEQDIPIGVVAVVTLASPKPSARTSQPARPGRCRSCGRRQSCGGRGSQRVGDVRGDQRLALLQRRHGGRGCAGRNWCLGDAEAGDGVAQRYSGAAVGPAGAERDVDAQAELAAFGLRVVDVVEHLGREEGKVLEALGGVVEHLGILEGELGALDAVGLHLLQLAQDLRLHDRRAEPPPADHGPGFIGRIDEVLAQGLDGGRGRLRGERGDKREQKRGGQAVCGEVAEPCADGICGR
jgi:hypothetical protein